MQNKKQTIASMLADYHAEVMEALTAITARIEQRLEIQKEKRLVEKWNGHVKKIMGHGDKPIAPSEES